EDADGEFVFSTRACQVDPQSQVVEMEPGQSESVDYEWERIGTDEQCENIVEDIEPGQYQLVVGLGEQTADPVTFELKKLVVADIVRGQLDDVGNFLSGVVAWWWPAGGVKDFCYCLV